MSAAGTIEARVLDKLREFAGNEPEHEEGAEATDLMPDDESVTYGQTVAALHRLSRKGLAVAYRWTGIRGGDTGSRFLWYPVRPW